MEPLVERPIVDPVRMRELGQLLSRPAPLAQARQGDPQKPPTNGQNAAVVILVLQVLAVADPLGAP